MNSFSNYALVTLKLSRQLCGCAAREAPSYRFLFRNYAIGVTVLSK